MLLKSFFRRRNHAPLPDTDTQSSGAAVDQGHRFSIKKADREEPQQAPPDTWIKLLAAYTLHFSKLSPDVFEPILLAWLKSESSLLLREAPLVDATLATAIIRVPAIDKPAPAALDMLTAMLGQGRFAQARFDLFREGFSNGKMSSSRAICCGGFLLKGLNPEQDLLPLWHQSSIFGLLLRRIDPAACRVFQYAQWTKLPISMLDAALDAHFDQDVFAHCPSHSISALLEIGWPIQIPTLQRIAWAALTALTNLTGRDSEDIDKCAALTAWVKWSVALLSSSGIDKPSLNKWLALAPNGKCLTAWNECIKLAPSIDWEALDTDGATPLHHLLGAVLSPDAHRVDDHTLEWKKLWVRSVVPLGSALSIRDSQGRRALNMVQDEAHTLSLIALTASLISGQATSSDTPPEAVTQATGTCEAKSAQRCSNSWQICRAANVKALLDEWKNSSDASSGGERKALAKLINSHLDEEGFWLPLIGCTDLDTSIDALRAGFPHFSNVIDHIARHLVLRAHGDGSLWFPPMLLVGAPGIGKTFFLSELARLSGTRFNLIGMAGVSGSIVLNGVSSMWSGSKQGAISEMILCEGACANPLCLLDEIDKSRSVGYGYPADLALLAPIEPVTGATFRDEFVGLPMDLRRVIWVASANDEADIYPALLSRFDVFHIQSPDAKAKQAMVRGVFVSLLKGNEWGDKISPVLDEESAQRVILNIEDAREIKRMLYHAVAATLQDGRNQITPADIPTRPAGKHPPMGFHAA